MKTSTIILIVIGAFILLLGGCAGCGAISLQKKAVTMEENIKGMWANVESEYQRRADLIPNLVNTVKGEASFERGTLESVINARARATSIQVNPENLTPEKLREFQQAQGELSQALGRLMVISEQYPTLHANEAFRGLQRQLEGTENRIKVARNDFNKATQEYNSTIRRFPNNFYAGWLGFEPKGYFEADPGSERAPTVNFDEGAKTPSVGFDSTSR